MVPIRASCKATRCVYDRVAKNVEQKYCVLVAHPEQRTGTRCVCDMVTKNVEQQYCVTVPY